MDSILVPGIDLSVRSIYKSCRRDAASVAASSESEEQSGITTTFVNTFNWDKIFHEFSSKETRECHPPDEVNEFRLQRHISQQARFHHRNIVLGTKKKEYLSKNIFFG